MTNEAAYRFDHAITRAPADTAVQGLRAVDTGAPDLTAMRAQHIGYVAALREAGMTVCELPPLPAFPDAQFVEDTALCLPGGAIVLRPGAPSRLGEAAEMAPQLAKFYDRIAHIEGPGHVEGGDILVTAHEVLVGRSARTDAAGIAELRTILDGWNYRLREVTVPPGVLHFKTDCSLLDNTTVLVTPRLAAAGVFAGYRQVPTAPGEEAAANAIRVNDVVLFPAGFPATARRLRGLGYRVVELEGGEFAKLDGGMSCLSLRFAAPKASGSAG